VPWPDVMRAPSGKSATAPRRLAGVQIRHFVRTLLASGVDPNALAEPSGREWVSCAGIRPRPLKARSLRCDLHAGH